MKNIYELKLHEMAVIETRQATDGAPVKWMVTRVPGGWIYQRNNVNVTDQTTTFVPYNSEFCVKRPIPTNDTNTVILKHG